MENGRKVSEIMQERYGYSIPAGQRGICPFCGGNNFTVTKNNTMGKCWNCGEKITVTDGNPDCDNSISILLDDIYDKCKKELVEQKTHHLNGVNNSYTYLMDRKIHSQIIETADIGIVPATLNLDPKIEELIAKIQEKIDEKKAICKLLTKKEAAGLWSEIEKLKEAMNILEALQKKWAKTFIKDFICFFYRDAKDNLVAVRTRNPVTKQIYLFKPFKEMGTFGYNPFDEDSKELIVVEGEFNQLQLLNLHYRYAKEEGLPYFPPNVCAIGGVANADIKTIKKLVNSSTTLNNYLTVIYDNDEANTGFKLVEDAQQLFAVKAITTPSIDSDIDSYITAYDNNYINAWDSVQELFKNYTMHYRLYLAVVNEIKWFRRANKVKEFDINTSVADVIWKDLSQRGKFYFEGVTLYYFSEETKALVQIHKDFNELKILLSQYGLIASETIYNYVLHHIYIEGLKQGNETKIHQISFFNKNTFTAYLNSYDNKMYRIDESSIEHVDNGTDNVLFINEDGKPFTICAPPVESESLFDKILINPINFTEGILSVEDRKLLHKCWCFSIFFCSIMPTKPLEAFIGTYGSGKTSALRKLGYLLLGADFQVTNLEDKAEHFDVAVSCNEFVVFDNADAKKDWLEDRLATIATGSSRKIRELYNTNKMRRIVYDRCFVGLTAHTPKFRRPDVAERLLLMPVDVLPADAIIAEDIVRNEVLDNRNYLMYEVVHHIQEIIKALKTSPDTLQSFRLADFGNFCCKIAIYSGFEDKMRNIFKKLAKEQAIFSMATNPIRELLDIWVIGNVGRKIEYSDLYFEIKVIAERQNISFTFSNSKSFAGYLGSIKKELTNIYNLEVTPWGGHRKLYAFHPNLDEVSNLNETLNE